MARFLHADDRVTTLARGKFFQTFWPNPEASSVTPTKLTGKVYIGQTGRTLEH